MAHCEKKTIVRTQIAQHVLIQNKKDFEHHTASVLKGCSKTVIL